MEIKEQIYSRYIRLKEFGQMAWDESALTRIEKAFQFSLKVIGENKFKTGEVIINHSLDVASIIAIEIGLEPDSVVSGLLHNVMYNGLQQKATKGEIEKVFGVNIYSILEGMAKINALSTDSVDIYSENYRKLLLALAGDVRVIIIKIADRLQIMRYLDRYDLESQKRLVNETSHLYAPLAHRLGLYAINSELQDLCLKYQKPEAFNYVVNRLKETETERANFVAEFVKPVEKKLQKKGFKFSMKARTKSIFSIWNKMQKKNVSFDEVMDLFAIRIILDSKPEDEKSDCWTAYSFVTEE
ncbi:MAG TPA: HD domain-containing protein, partial [Draconibacterium sp.]|nr:HD domain-containing protein [Draconibacterium sp.]